MSDTLQQKIDEVLSSYPNEVSVSVEGIEQGINKALQEFREQIADLEKTAERATLKKLFLDGYNQALADVLALIGEKNE